MNKTILFFEKTPFMGVELLNFIRGNYFSISYYNDGCYQMLKNLGYPVLTFNNTDLTKFLDSDKAVVSIFSDKRFLNGIVKGTFDNNHAIFFYMNGELDALRQKSGMKILLPPYNIQEKLGNKLFLQEICQKLNIKVNKTINFNLSDYDLVGAYKKCKSYLGMPFIIQGEFGVSGEDTFKVNSFKEFSKYCNEMNNKFRATRYLKDIVPISVHICIIKEEIAYEGPYIQIIGFKELTLNPFQFSGNDTNQQLLTEQVKRDVKSMSINIASYANKLGYKGVFGIDFLWDRSSGRVFVQEINSRLVGLTRLLTGIQKEQKIIPHLIKHISEFISIQGLKDYENKPIDLSKHDYSQIYISNNFQSMVSIKSYLLPGIYKIVKNKLIRTRDSLFLSNMDNDEILITFSAYKGSKLKPDQIIAKIILKQSVLDGNKYLLSEKVRNLITIIKNSIFN